MKSKASAGAVALILLSGCSPRVLDLRPFAAHPDQKMDGEDVVVSWQNHIRTSVRYMRSFELDAAFRLPGRSGETANPFLFRPPAAAVKFTVFRLNFRNESEYDTFVEYDKILLRDDLGGEFRPLSMQKLMDYWLGRVAIELGRPVTWTAQMAALKEKKEKEKLLIKTVYEGGRLPSRGEHTGYIAFRDIPPEAKQLQLLIEVVTRSSRYGNPLSIVLSEFNFKVTKIHIPSKSDEEMKEWRNQ
jgi:hypothetical protein